MFGDFQPILIGLVVSNPLKNISQNGNLPQIEVKIKHQLCKDLLHHPIESQPSYKCLCFRFQVVTFRTSFVYIPSPSQPVQSPKLHTPSNVVGKVGAVLTVAKEPGKNVPTKTNSTWWFRPVWKICLSIWIISPSRGEKKTYLEPPHRIVFPIP